MVQFPGGIDKINPKKLCEPAKRLIIDTENHLMKKLFGTDGIRGVAGQSPLDPATIHAVGLALAHHLGNAPRVLIGQDTRESSDWIAAALTAGLTTGGATVEQSLGLAQTETERALRRGGYLK